MKRLFPILLISVLFFSCTKEKFETRIFLVAAQRTTCATGTTTQQACLQVKINSSDPYVGFSNEIEGFNYVEGFEYTIEVRVYERKNPPADGSSLRFVLHRIISKK
ncbi:MAG TPA: DUF4377 domain-containing protein [Segetibacter sp.]|jgi:hypothetical protein